MEVITVTKIGARSMRFKIIKGPTKASLAILVLMLGASASNVAVAQQWNIEPFIEHFPDIC